MQLIAMPKPDKPLLEFPCVFPLKAIGKGGDDFGALVFEIVSRHVPGLTDTALTSRPSSSGNYLAVTVTFTAHSRDQLDAIYLELNAHERVVMTL
ncbi:MAG TPA: DUF493 domain-containing protein [Anaerolineaceae bacterium]|jgi:putative lipoic acid-binding regulatory protein|nr:DUF493 domain-containing protein [Anaerolineaceae bacterium]